MSVRRKIHKRERCLPSPWSSCAAILPASMANSRKDGRDNGHFDMHAAARRIVSAGGFEVDLPGPARDQLNKLAGPAKTADGVRDLRDRPWSSIDNDESRDLDQVEYAERLPDGSIRIVVGIADVDSLVGKDTPLDEHANVNSTSV